MAMDRFVAYYRVSTGRQSKSCLGLDAQRKFVKKFIGEGTLIAEFTDIESEIKTRRPQLRLALETCRKRGAALVIARPEQLGRRLAFIAGLMTTGVPFFAVNTPHAYRFRLHLQAAVADHKKRRLRARTQLGLHTVKGRGVQLGGFRGRHLSEEDRTKGSAIGAKVRAKQARQNAIALLPIVKEIRAAGAASLTAIAEGLNRRGVRTPKGGSWYPNTVARLLARLEPKSRKIPARGA
jgi:DNA invertase Pin-like site-specific DNA recombinase